MRLAQGNKAENENALNSKKSNLTLSRNKTKAFIIECPFIIVYKLDRYNKICYFKMIIGNVRTTKIIIFLISLAQGNKAENKNDFVTLTRNKREAFIFKCPFIIVYKLDRCNRICYFKMLL
jgi:hypothetical protein